MKLLIQSDDYGITPAVSDGIIYGITHGVVRNTGLFSNMPWAKECVEKIIPYLDDIAFGIDLNASTGSSLLGYDKVPNLCHPDGSFLTSKENRKADETAPNHDHVNHDQLYAEFDAQVQKFIELVGKVPDYIHAHAYGTATTEQVRREIAQKYDRPYSKTTSDLLVGGYTNMNWYIMGGPEAQLNEDLESFIVENQSGFDMDGYGYLITHCGYADAVLFELSSFNLCRVKDLQALTGDRVKNWIKDNNIELITYNDLDRDHWAN
ncbi:MAG: ChbG/HpnK family deacetylase [Bulleidia sp.]